MSENPSKRELGETATAILRNHGYDRDGRPRQEHTPEQDGFERNIVVKPRMEKLRPHDPHRHRF